MKVKTILIVDPPENRRENPILEMGILYNAGGMENDWRRWNDSCTVYADVFGNKIGDKVVLLFKVPTSSPGLAPLSRYVLENFYEHIAGVIQSVGGTVVSPLVIPSAETRYERVLHTHKSLGFSFNVDPDGVSKFLSIVSGSEAS